MTKFTGEAEDGFGLIGFLSHLLISLGVLVVIVAIFGWLFDPHAEIFGLLIGGGGAGVVVGLALGFVNILFS